LGMTAAGSRQAKLVVAEEWLLGRKAIQADASTGQTRRIPVTSSAKSIKVSSGYDIASPVRWCRDEFACQDVHPEVINIPAPANTKAPFPLPGEGIRPNEQAMILDFEIPSGTGYIELRVDAQKSVTSGAFRRDTVSRKIWSE